MGWKNFNLRESSVFLWEIYNRSLSGLIGNEFVFAGMGAQPVTGYRNDFNTNFKSLFGWAGVTWKVEIGVANGLKENKIEVKEGKEYYFVIENWLQDYQKQVCFLMMRCLSWEQDYYCFPFTLIKRKRERLTSLWQPLLLVDGEYPSLLLKIW